MPISRQPKMFVSRAPLPALAALIVALHRISQEGLPFLVVGAGLPSLPGLAGEARSYAERLFRYVDIDSLNDAEAHEALRAPAEQQGVTWEDTAIDLVVTETRGYPYFLQEFGKQSWNVAQENEICLADVEIAAHHARADLDEGFFRARLDRTTDSEREYLRAMAAIAEPGPYRSGEISRRLGKKTTQTGPTRDGLIKRGLIYAPRHGEIDFTVPMFDDFLRRTL